MGTKDLTEKQLEAYNDVFADIFNVLIFGKDYIDEDHLVDAPTESLYVDSAGNTRNQFRDQFKYYKKDDLDLNICVLLGVENQTKSDYYMPVRKMGYDFAEYRRQQDRTKDEERLKPVVSIVLNFGNNRWDKPCSLKGIMSIPEDIDPYVEDYRVKVYDIAYLDNEVINSFESDFGIVAAFLSDKRQGKMDIVNSNTRLRHGVSVLELLEALTGDERYNYIKDNIIEKERKGAVISMCTFAEEMTQRGISQGISRGEQKMVNIFQWLIDNGRSEDSLRFMTDEEFRVSIMEEYELANPNDEYN